MAQGQHLEVERDSGPHQPSEREEQRNQHRYHREESLSVTAGKFNGANEYGLFSRHRTPRASTRSLTDGLLSKAQTNVDCRRAAGRKSLSGP
jgi:hypothetical protein